MDTFCKSQRLNLESFAEEEGQTFQQKYGQEVDEEDMSVHYDADGTPWIQTSGTGVATDLRAERLEQMLSVVKDLYSEKYGHDVDTEYDADGTAWKVTVGTGVPCDCRVERLAQKLAEVKQLYQQKYGQEVDEEDMSVHYDADGTPWIQTSGTGVATDLRVERLEQMLSVVKDLYSEKYGHDVDTEYDADGTAWKVTVGTGVPCDCRVERLAQKLAEVKQLYQQKYGQEVDEEDMSVHDADQLLEGLSQEEGQTFQEFAKDTRRLESCELKVGFKKCTSQHCCSIVHQPVFVFDCLSRVVQQSVDDKWPPGHQPGPLKFSWKGCWFVLRKLKE